MPSYGFIKNPPPALRAFLVEREKHSASAERLAKLAEAAMAEQEEAEEREAERIRRRRPKLVSTRG
jgi:hypothetical protein